MKRVIIFVGALLAIQTILLPGVGFSFIGSYNPTAYYDYNISNGVTIAESPSSIVVTAGSRPNDLNVELTVGTQSGTLPFIKSGSMASIPYRNHDYGLGGYTKDSIMLSDGNNMAFCMIGQEYDDPTDVSFWVSTWQKSSATVTINDLVGIWKINFYSNDNLRDTSDRFSPSTHTLTIAKIDDDIVKVDGGPAGTLNLEVDGNRAYLLNAPVTGPDCVLHDLEIFFDGSGLSIHFVASELNDPGDVSVTVGLGTCVSSPTKSCVSQKIKAASTLCKTVANCLMKNINDPSDCIDKAVPKFYSSWDKAVNNALKKQFSCDTEDREAISQEIKDRVRDMYDEISNAYDLGEKNEAVLGKALLTAAVTKCCSRLDAESTNAKKADSGKLGKAETKADANFSKSWEKAMAKAGNKGVNNVPNADLLLSIETIIENLVIDITNM